MPPRRDALVSALLLVWLATGSSAGAGGLKASERGDRGHRKGSTSPRSPRSPVATTPRSGVRGNAAETPGKFGRLSVRWEDPSPEMPGSGPVREDVASRHAELFAQLEKAFGDRAVWSTLALRNTLGVSREVLRETLPYMAYKFRDGPWKGLWTRFGYDPRANPKARALQVSGGGRLEFLAH